MEILTFEFQDGATGWTLEPMSLDSFNLLVGLSGAGKTRIVRAERGRPDDRWVGPRQREELSLHEPADEAKEHEPLAYRPDYRPTLLY